MIAQFLSFETEKLKMISQEYFAQLTLGLVSEPVNSSYSLKKRLMPNRFVHCYMYTLSRQNII